MRPKPLWCIVHSTPARLRILAAVCQRLVCSPSSAGAGRDQDVGTLPVAGIGTPRMLCRTNFGQDVRQIFARVAVLPHSRPVRSIKACARASGRPLNMPWRATSPLTSSAMSMGPSGRQGAAPAHIARVVHQFLPLLQISMVGFLTMARAPYTAAPAGWPRAGRRWTEGFELVDRGVLWGGRRYSDKEWHCMAHRPAAYAGLHVKRHSDRRSRRRQLFMAASTALLAAQGALAGQRRPW